MARFVLTVAANSSPARLARVIVDPARPEDVTPAAWAAVYPDTPLPSQPEWRHVDGAYGQASAAAAQDY